MGKKDKAISLGWDAFKAMGNPDNAEDIDLSEETEDTENLSDAVRVYLERKGRGGKTVSVIKGLSADDDYLTDLCKTLKSKCGVGGSVEDGHIVIQGDQRTRLIKELRIIGYNNVKNAGA